MMIQFVDEYIRGVWSYLIWVLLVIEYFLKNTIGSYIW